MFLPRTPHVGRTAPQTFAIDGPHFDSIVPQITSEKSAVLATLEWEAETKRTIPKKLCSNRLRSLKIECLITHTRRESKLELSPGYMEKEYSTSNKGKLHRHWYWGFSPTLNRPSVTIKIFWGIKNSFLTIYIIIIRYYLPSSWC